MQTSQKRRMVKDIESDADIQQGYSLINFGVSWSVLCKIQNSIVENVAKVFENEVFIANVDLEKYPKAKSRFRIQNLPTILILKDGVEIRRFEAIQPEEILAEELNKITNAISTDISRKTFWTSFKDKELEQQLFKKEILIIDDDPDITFCIRSILEEANFSNIELSNDFQSTMEYLEENIPNLIILNIMMHNKEGNKIMATIRRNENLNNIPILVSVGPIEPTRNYEDTFKEAAFLKHGKYVEWPRNRQSFILLVRHMLLYKERTITDDTQKISFGSICPKDQ